MSSKKTQDDDLVMSLVETALALPPEEREAYLTVSCHGDSDLYAQVWKYVESEGRMGGFLLEPLLPAVIRAYPFQPNQLLNGRFRITRLVAQGGMGLVFEAYDETLERRIAIKCAKAGFQKRLPPEVRHASEIAHPNVCKIFEFHTAPTPAGEIDFFTMEFLEGETLSERLAREPLGKEEASTIARQLSSGLAEAHRNQVIHGDLKSNNVIVTTGEDKGLRAVITDFGLARRPAARFMSAPSGTRAGAVAYMAPELLKGEKASMASDVYALGVVLHELVHGRRPGDASGPDSAPKQRTARKLPPVPSNWDNIITRCLDPDPTRRFTASELSHALAPPVSRRWWLTAAIAAILALATGVAVYVRATWPKESWRLAMLPVQSGTDVRAEADALTRDATLQLAKLKGGKVARLSVIPISRVRGRDADSLEKGSAALGATHVLRTTLSKQNGKLMLRAVLTDERTGANLKEWTTGYAPDEMRFAPVAVTGLVASQLGLPPLVASPSVKPAAAQDYWHGLWYMRHNSTMDFALPLLERAVAEDSDSPLTFSALAEAQQWKWFMSRDEAWLARARDSERDAQRRNPDLAQVHRVAGLLSLRDGHLDLAASECLRAIALDPKDGEAHRVLGQAHERSGRRDEALAEFRKALELDPKDYRNHVQLGAFYYKRADYRQAIPHFLDALQLSPDEAKVHGNLAECYIQSDRLREAESEYRRAIFLGETDLMQDLGVVFMHEGKYPEFVSTLESALRIAPDDLLCRMNLGTAYRLMKRKAESEKAYQHALELAEKQIAHDPLNGKTRSHLAFICARLGYAARAESEIAQAQKLSPEDADVRFMAVATLEALGRRDESLRILAAVPKYEELLDVKRWPDLADLCRDSRFVELLASRKTN